MIVTPAAAANSHSLFQLANVGMSTMHENVMGMETMNAGAILALRLYPSKICPSAGPESALILQ
jgi:hypothetical protein